MKNTECPAIKFYWTVKIHLLLSKAFLKDWMTFCRLIPTLTHPPLICGLLVWFVVNSYKMIMLPLWQGGQSSTHPWAFNVFGRPVPFLHRSLLSACFHFSSANVMTMMEWLLISSFQLSCGLECIANAILNFYNVNLWIMVVKLCNKAFKEFNFSSNLKSWRS